MWVCVRIFAQLVAINSNRHLSQIVRNLTELLHRSNLMERDGYDEHENITPDMVPIVCFSLNQVIALVQVPILTCLILIGITCC